MFLFEKSFVLKLYKTKFLSSNLKDCAVLSRTPSVVDIKAKTKPITYVFDRKKNRFKTLQKKKFLSCNLNGCALLRRIPSEIDVKEKQKPITDVFVRNNFRTKRS